MTQFKVCFVSTTIYPLLKADNQLELVGGAEVQQMYLGQEMANRGYSVLYVTLDYGQRSIEYIEKYKVIASYTPKKGMPFFRFIYPITIKIWKALFISNADIFYVRTAGSILAPVVIFARALKKKVIYCAADNRDFNPEKIRLETRDKRLFYWALKRCDRIISQNKMQAELLKRNFNKDTTIIPNGIPKIENGAASRSEILWVGTLRKVKKPEFFLELAQKVPSENFVMIGGRDKSDNSLYQEIENRANNIPNLQFKGFIPFDKIEKFFSRAKLFINTSETEGFPNTFLQAWKNGIPVISFVDPDNIIMDNNLGLIVKDIDEMKKTLQNLRNKKITFSHQKILKFCQKNFTTEKIVDMYEDIFSDLMNHN